MKVLSEVTDYAVDTLRVAQRESSSDPLEQAKATIISKLEQFGDDPPATESAIAYLGVGYLDLALFNYSNARPQLERALQLVDEKTEPSLYAGILKFYSDALCDETDQPSSELISALIANYKKSGQILREVGEYLQSADAFSSATHLQFHEGSYENALISAKAAADLFRITNSPNGIHKIEVHLSKILLKFNQPKEALEHANEGLLNIQSVMRESDISRQPLANTYLLIGEIHLKLSDQPNALAAYQNVLRTLSAESSHNPSVAKLRSEAQDAINIINSTENS